LNFAILPAARYPLPDLVQFLNRGFEDYVVPIRFDPVTFANMQRKDDIDLRLSRVLIVDGQPCGIALIAPRPARRASRLAAMGIAREIRGKGAGTWLMEQLIGEARQRGEGEMVLEVIEQNEPAVRLYRKHGFQTVRRLVGLSRKDARENERGDLQKIDLGELGRLISQHGLPDLPWQLSGETISNMEPPVCAYRQGPAYLAISSPEAEHVAIWSLLVEPQWRGRGLGSRLLRQVIAEHADKTWHIPALLPEELGRTFEKAGFERGELSQWQMRLSL
jgi:ribosomal protein S18 acetylase RimI-like enzyme